MDEDYNPWDLDSDEYRMPGQVIKNYNSQHNDPQPVSNYFYTMLKNQTVRLKFRVDPLRLETIIIMPHL